MESYGARFAGVVFPGETLRVSVWKGGDGFVAVVTAPDRDNAVALAGVELSRPDVGTFSFSKHVEEYLHRQEPIGADSPSAEECFQSPHVGGAGAQRSTGTANRFGGRSGRRAFRTDC